MTQDRLTLSARGLHQASGKTQFSVTQYHACTEMFSQTKPATDFEGPQKRRPGSVGMGGRCALESVGGMDRNTQPPSKIDPQLSRQSETFHRQTVRVRGSMRSSFGVSVSIAPDGW